MPNDAPSHEAWPPPRGTVWTNGVDVCTCVGPVRVGDEKAALLEARPHRRMYAVGAAEKGLWKQTERRGRLYWNRPSWAVVLADDPVDGEPLEKTMDQRSIWLVRVWHDPKDIPWADEFEITAYRNPENGPSQEVVQKRIPWSRVRGVYVYRDEARAAKKAWMKELGLARVTAAEYWDVDPGWEY